MATRVQLDANGIRVSRPGFDANGGLGGMLLNTLIRYGQILDHILINLNRHVYDGPNTAYRDAINEGIDYCDGTFFYGPYPEAPDAICVGLVDGRYEYPPVEYGADPRKATGKWQLSVTPGAASCPVRFDRAVGELGYSVKMPHQAMLLVYRKPRFA